MSCVVSCVCVAFQQTGKCINVHKLNDYHVLEVDGSYNCVSVKLVLTICKALYTKTIQQNAMIWRKVHSYIVIDETHTWWNHIIVVTSYQIIRYSPNPFFFLLNILLYQCQCVSVYEWMNLLECYFLISIRKNPFTIEWNTFHRHINIKNHKIIACIYTKQTKRKYHKTWV